jgi:hypothetical protein
MHLLELYDIGSRELIELLNSILEERDMAPLKFSEPHDSSFDDDIPF